MIQNAGSEKKDPSPGSWNYKEIIQQLESQNNKKKFV